MDKWVKLNNEAAGRDKIARLIQYSSRVVWDSLEAADCKPSFSERFRTVEYILSSFRKLLRFGRCVDVFWSSLHTIHYPDLTIRLTLTIGKISQALFLLADHLMWLSRTGLFSNIDVKKWNTFANKYWMLSITMNLCRDIYEIIHAMQLHKAGINSGITRKTMTTNINSPRDLSRLAWRSYIMMRSYKNVVVDTVKNICDLFIPLTALGYTDLTPRTVGLLGVISSTAGLIALLDPSAKLSPA